MVQTGYLRPYVIIVEEKIKNLNSKVSVFLEHNCDDKYSFHLISFFFFFGSLIKLMLVKNFHCPVILNLLASYKKLLLALVRVLVSGLHF